MNRLYPGLCTLAVALLSACSRDVPLLTLIPQRLTTVLAEGAQRYNRAGREAGQAGGRERANLEGGRGGAKARQGSRRRGGRRLFVELYSWFCLPLQPPYSARIMLWNPAYFKYTASEYKLFGARLGRHNINIWRIGRRSVGR